jgi:hypothetical protein
VAITVKERRWQLWRNIVTSRTEQNAATARRQEHIHNAVAQNVQGHPLPVTVRVYRAEDTQSQAEGIYNLKLLATEIWN